MRRLVDGLIGGMRHLEVPATVDELCTVLCDLMAARRGRDCELRMTAFPPGSVSGLWVELDERDLILVEENTAADHQLVILGHEIWHMAAGHRALHVEGKTVAARLLAGDADLEPVIRQVAARSRGRNTTDACHEEEAESFGLLLASRVRPWLAGWADSGGRSGLAARVGTSLDYSSARGAP
ncbi:toxin-antitoxin system, toxin component [Streptomyces sp. NPDC021100]|uniref:toxin-antitoxin system, toxin component n=1 Tax=Streptomyces sp. NPDC021100 TaxID=3365114 RepID=UPI0037AC62C3